MVAALNCWWPDGNAFRSTDGGQTWTQLWDWASYPTMNRFYTYDDSLAPWLGPDVTASSIVTQIGWMMEALAIDPFDSNHWLYGTGATIYGGHDLLKWDTARNVTIKSLADGIEETAVQALLSPPTGPSLLSGVLDEEGRVFSQLRALIFSTGWFLGFVHSNLNVAPSAEFATSTSSGITGLDYAGNNPTMIVRVGNGDASDGKQVAISPDSGTTWYDTSGSCIVLDAYE